MGEAACGRGLAGYRACSEERLAAAQGINGAERTRTTENCVCVKGGKLARRLCRTAASAAGAAALLCRRLLLGCDIKGAAHGIGLAPGAVAHLCNLRLELGGGRGS